MVPPRLDSSFRYTAETEGQLSIRPQDSQDVGTRKRKIIMRPLRLSTLISLSIAAILTLAANDESKDVVSDSSLDLNDARSQPRSRIKITFARAHIVLTKDDRSQSLVLTGEDGKGGGNGNQLVIAGHNMGGGDGDGQDSNMIMQDADNREGDVVMNGKSMIIPGEDGHIVLADSRSSGRSQSGPMPNFFSLWLPFMGGRMGYRMAYPLFGGQMFG